MIVKDLMMLKTVTPVAFIFLSLAFLSIAEAFVLTPPQSLSNTVTYPTRRSVGLLLRTSTHADDDDENGSFEESISRLRHEYKTLQEKFRANLLLEQKQGEKSTDALAGSLLNREMEITSLQIHQQEEKTTKAKESMKRAIDDIKQAQVLKAQTMQETVWAFDETEFLESTTTTTLVDDDGAMRHHQQHKYAELEAFLLAQAVHDWNATNEILAQAEKDRADALKNEVRAKDMLWYLVQREEKLKDLQMNHDKKKLREWAIGKLPEEKSVINFLKKKTIDHDPKHGSVLR